MTDLASECRSTRFRQRWFLLGMGLFFLIINIQYLAKLHC